MSILHGWQPRLGTGLNIFRNTLNDQQLALVNTPTEVTLEGTPFSPEIMNELEQAIANSAIINFDAAPTSKTAGAVGQFGAYDGMIYYCTSASIYMTTGLLKVLEAGTYYFYSQNLPISFTLTTPASNLTWDGTTLKSGLSTSAVTIETYEFPQGTELTLTDNSTYTWRELEPAASTVPIPDDLATALGLSKNSTVADALSKLNSAKLATSGGSITGDLSVGGTLSINGSTVSDYIVAQGTSGKWRYWKYNSGLAICIHDSIENGNFNNNASSAGWGGWYDLPEYTFSAYPFTFSAVPAVYISRTTAHPNTSTEAYNDKFVFIAMTGGSTTNPPRADIARPTFSVIGGPQLSLVAIGRWK